MHSHICPKGCRQHARRVGTSLALHEASGRGTTAVRVATRPSMTAAYAQMLAQIPSLRPAPALEFYDDLHGVGGLFIPTAWVIAVGVKDMERLVDNLLATRHDEVVAIAHELAQASGTRPSSVRELLIGAAMGRCMSHELGHALIFRGWPNPYRPDEEAGADYYAGKLDAARGRDWRIGALFFAEIGCIGPTCTHPTPHERRNAYTYGYNEQLSPRAA